MTTITLLEPTTVGDSDARSKMVSGFNCLTKMDSIALKEKRENFQIELKNALINCDSKKSDKEIQFLKELIVSHLDVIQQQSEQLAIKDRLINKLKNEKDTLEMRLLRMERRVNLERDSDGSVLLGTSSGRGPLTLGAKGRRGSTDSLNKGKSAISQANHQALLPVSTQPRESKKQKRNRQMPDDEGDSVDGRRGSGASGVKLTTERLYYTSVGEQECRWGLEQLQSKPHQSVLEVPSWRIRTYSSSYTMEGTENLSDEVFERRHSSLSKDEKRRKRWDVQRIREIRQNERLRQRQVGQSGSGGSKSESGFESLWPRPTRDTQLIVHQSVPVAAFGVTLQSLPQRDFAFSSYSFPSTRLSKYTKRLRR